MKSKLRFAIPALIVVALIVFATNLSAQENSQMLDVFVDCGSCDLDYLKQKVVFVNYVSDRKNADLHVLATKEAAGGGEKWHIRFIGLKEQTGKDQALSFFSRTADTSEEKRQQFVRVLSLGLLRYVAETALASKISISYEGKSNDSVSKGKDLWNYWVFSASVYGYMSGEARSGYEYFRGSLAANRITEGSKLSFGSYLSHSKNRYKLEDGSSITNSSLGYSHKGQAIKSMGEHWGAGAAITMQRSTYYNLRPSYRAVLAVEYNLFPYKKSSERALTFTYFTGLTRLNYEEATIFDKLRETRFTQGMMVNLDAKRAWGDASLSAQLTHLGKTSNRRATFRGDVTWRIAKGLSLNPYGGIEFIRDQIYLSKKGLSDQDIFLGRRALRTNFSYFVGLGVTFTFGSKYSNVVNRRLDSVSSFGTIF